MLFGVYLRRHPVKLQIQRPQHADSRAVFDYEALMFRFAEQWYKNMGRPLSVMAHLRKIIIEVKTETNCLAHSLIIAIAKLTNDPDYKA